MVQSLVANAIQASVTMGSTSAEDALILSFHIRMSVNKGDNGSLSRMTTNVANFLLFFQLVFTRSLVRTTVNASSINRITVSSNGLADTLLSTELITERYQWRLMSTKRPSVTCAKLVYTDSSCPQHLCSVSTSTPLNRMSRLSTPFKMPRTRSSVRMTSSRQASLSLEPCHKKMTRWMPGCHPTP